MTAAKVGLPFLPGSEAAFVNLCLLPLDGFTLGSLERKKRSHSVSTAPVQASLGLSLGNVNAHGPRLHVQGNSLTQPM